MAQHHQDHSHHDHASHPGGHHHHHAVAATDLTPSFKIAVLLNTAYVVIEAAAGVMVGSLALIADAAHNLTDVAGLLIAWGAAVLARKPPSERFSYGFGRTTILAALANAVTILIGIGAVIYEAVHRFADPSPVAGLPVLVVAAIGIAINAGTALLFRDARHHDLNAEGAFLHMAADAAVSLGVVISALGIMLTGWMWLDPLAAIVVSALIAWTAFDLLRSSLGLSLDGVPKGIDRKAVAACLADQPGVRAVHDLHIWSLSTTSMALTAHLVMPGGHPGDDVLAAMIHLLEERFGIGHATLQIEMGNGAACNLEPDDVV